MWIFTLMYRVDLGTMLIKWLLLKSYFYFVMYMKEVHHTSTFLIAHLCTSWLYEKWISITNWIKCSGSLKQSKWIMVHKIQKSLNILQHWKNMLGVPYPVFTRAPLVGSLDMDYWCSALWAFGTKGARVNTGYGTPNMF